MRIVSLIASATEIVSALGFQNQLVARSHECDYPETVQQLPACSRPKIDIHASSAEIDRQVKQVVSESLSVYHVDADKLRALHPDVIITQDHCEVCAVSLKDVEAAVGDWLSVKPKIVSLRPESLQDVWGNVRQIADALGITNTGEQLVHQLQSRMEGVTERVKNIKRTPTVACLEWIDPLMAGGNWIPEMVEMLQAECLFGTAGEHSPWMTWDELIQKDPDIIITMPCGFDIARTLDEMPILTAKPEWRELRAVRNNRVYITDGNQYFNRPGPRLVESLEIMAELIYPEGAQYGYENGGWVNLKTA